MLQMRSLALLTVFGLFSSVLTVSHHSSFDQFIGIALAQKKETAPIADPGPAISAYGADIITLDGSKSFDRDGDPIIKYHWGTPCCCPVNQPSLFVGPTGETSCNAEGKTITVQIPNVEQPTDYQVDLTVSDGKFSSNPPAALIIHALPVE